MTETPPTHYFTQDAEGVFKIHAFDPANIPEGVTFMCVDATKTDAPVQCIVDKEGRKTGESIPDGLQDAVKNLLNPTTGGRRRRSRRQSRRQSKRQSKRQNGGRRRRQSKRRQRR